MWSHDPVHLLRPEVFFSQTIDAFLCAHINTGLKCYWNGLVLQVVGRRSDSSWLFTGYWFLYLLTLLSFHLFLDKQSSLYLPVWCSIFTLRAGPSLKDLRALFLGQFCFYLTERRREWDMTHDREREWCSRGPEPNSNRGCCNYMVRCDHSDDPWLIFKIGLNPGHSRRKAQSSTARSIV